MPPKIATRPFDKSHQVPQCESDAYVWAHKLADDTLKLYFAVENPSGVSARALAAILDRTALRAPSARSPKSLPRSCERIFRQNISMGKGLGLMSMVGAVRRWRRALSDRNGRVGLQSAD